MSKNDLNWAIVKNLTIFREKDQKVRNQHTEKLEYQRYLPLESTMYAVATQALWAAKLIIESEIFVS